MTRAILAIFAAATLLVLFAGSAYAQPVWGQNAVYEGGAPVHDVPDGSSAANQTPFRFQSVRNMVGERAMVEHFWSDYVMGDDNGLHRVGSARVYLQDAAPTSLADSHPDAGALTDHNNTGAAAATDFHDGGSTSGSLVAQDDVGYGRLWVDADADYQLYVYEGEAGDGLPATIEDGWKAVTGNGLGINPQGYNLIYNGGWQAQVAGLDTDPPRGWVAVGPPASMTYGVTYSTEGAGLSLVIVDDGSTTQGITQVLTDLKSDATYTLVARGSNLVGTCTLLTTGGLTNVSETVVSPTTAATVSGTFTTSAGALDTVTVKLESTTASAVCLWDHVAVYENNPDPVPQPGVVVVNDEDEVSTSTIFADGTLTDSGLAVAVTVPSAGYVIMVNARIVVENDGAGSNHLECELREDTVAVDGAITTVDSPNTLQTLPLRHVNSSTTPGNTYDYVVFCAGEGSTWTMNDVIPTQNVTTRNFIDVVMIPVR